MLRINNRRTSCTIVKPGSLLLFMILFFNTLQGQSCKLFKNSEQFMPLVLLIIQDSVFDDINEKVTKSENIANTSFLLINGSKITSLSITDTVNSILNGNLNVNKNRVYLLIIGNKPFFEQQNRFLYDLFPVKYFIQTDNKGDFNDEAFNRVYYQDFNLEAILKTFGKYYLWQLELDKIETNNATDCKYPHQEFGIGFNLSTNHPMRVRTDAELGGSFVSYGVYGYRNINLKNKILTNFQFGFKKPSPKSGSKEMKGSTYISWFMEMQHLFYANAKFKPLIGLGLSFTSFTAMKGDMESMNSADMEMDRNSFQFPGILVSAGFEYSMGEKAILVFSPRYNLSMGSLDKSSHTLNNFSVQLGLSFRILGKKRCYYEYLKLR